MHDEPPEPDPQEEAEHAATAVKGTPDELVITLQTQVLQESLSRMVDLAVERGMLPFLDKQVKLSAEKQLVKMVDEEGRDRVKAILDKGWKKTNKWGEGSGEAITVDSMIREHLTAETTEGSYPNQRTVTVISRMVREYIAAEGQKVMKEALEEFKQGLKSAMTEKLTAQFRETMGAALGLKL